MGLDGESPTILHYQVDSPQVVTITVESVQPPDDDPLNDPVVTVITPGGEWLAYNNDHTTDRDDLHTSDAALTDLLLPEAGRYTLRANTYGGIYEGEVAVTVTPGDRYGAEIDRDDDVTQVSARLPQNVPYDYTFQANAGARVTLTARDTGSTLDPLVTLYGPDGDPLAQNDDHASDDLSLDVFDAQLAEVELPADSTYRVRVADILGRAGTFQLTVRVTPPGT